MFNKSRIGRFFGAIGANLAKALSHTATVGEVKEIDTKLKEAALSHAYGGVPNRVVYDEVAAGPELPVHSNRKQRRAHMYGERLRKRGSNRFHNKRGNPADKHGTSVKYGHESHRKAHDPFTHTFLNKHAMAIMAQHAGLKYEPSFVDPMHWEHVPPRMVRKQFQMGEQAA